MKKCSYCGRDNADDALNCRECGTEFESQPDAEAEADRARAEIRTLTLRIYPNREAAELAAAKLEAHGIACSVSSDDCGGMYPNLTAAAGARLQVGAGDSSLANTVLDSNPTPEQIKQMEREAALTPPPKSERSGKPAWGQIVCGILLGIGLVNLYQWRKQPATTTTHFHYTTNGVADEEWIYKDDQLVEYLEDRNLDQAWDHWRYYQQGIPVRSEFDNNFDGKPDLFWNFGRGGMDTLEKDTDFNGIADAFMTYKGQIVQTVDIKPNGSSFATKHEVYEHGVLKEIWNGGDSNGNFGEVVKYDPFLNPISTNTPAQPNGVGK